MADSSTFDLERLGPLVKESYMLSKEISAVDAKVRQDLEKYHGPLATWIHDNLDAPNENSPLGKLAVDKVKSQPFDWVQDQIVKMASIALGVAEWTLSRPLSLVTAILESEDQSWTNIRYMDSHTNDPLVKRYYQNKRRLAEVTDQIIKIHSAIPRSYDVRNTCRIDACIRQK